MLSKPGRIGTKAILLDWGSVRLSISPCKFRCTHLQGGSMQSAREQAHNVADTMCCVNRQRPRPPIPLAAPAPSPTYPLTLFKRQAQRNS